jgi:hypothetical protein
MLTQEQANKLVDELYNILPRWVWKQTIQEIVKPYSEAYTHPTTIPSFEDVYAQEYQQALDSCDHWIKWCKNSCDTHGVNFYEGMRAAHIFNNIKMGQLLRVLKQEPPNRAK